MSYSMEQLRTQGRAPARIVSVGQRRRLFIGDDEFPYPIERHSMYVTPVSARYNRLNLAIFVGEVAFETDPHTMSVDPLLRGSSSVNPLEKLPVIVSNESVSDAAAEAAERVLKGAMSQVDAEAFVRIAIDVINRGRR